MSQINLSALDLNLLVVLSVVLEEGNATRAAARLHVTQSAVSSSLRRLRAMFGDPLVVRTARGLVPTPRGAALGPQLAQALEGVRRVVEPEPVFDPATTTRAFTIAATDGVAMALLPALLRRMAGQAPRARLRLVTLDRMVAGDGLARGEVDLLVGIPPRLPAGCESEPVYDDPMRTLVRRDHPRVRGRLTLELFASLPHAEIALFGPPDDTIDRALARHGKAREVRVAVPQFSLLPLAVAGSDCVATLSERIARPLAHRLGLRVLTPPLELPTLRVVQVWHRRSSEDAGVRLLRRLVRDSSA